MKPLIGHQPLRIVTLLLLAIGNVANADGDLNGNGRIDAGDVDLLSAEIRRGSGDTRLDLNGDGVLNFGDHHYWVTELALTGYGDANLDRAFNTSDLVVAFQFGQYEDGLPFNSGWSGGDWDGDGDFTTGDFVRAFASTNPLCFEGCHGPRFAVAVPEPLTPFAFGIGAVFLGIGLRTGRTEKARDHNWVSIR